MSGFTSFKSAVFLILTILHSESMGACVIALLLSLLRKEGRVS